MHRRLHTLLLLLAPALAVACASNPNERTLAELEHVKPDVSDVQVENSIDQAMVGYRKFLDEAPESTLTPEAMRRLADLKLEKEYGIYGGKGSAELPAPEAPARVQIPREKPRPSARAERAEAASPFGPESDSDFEQRATGAARPKPTADSAALELPGGQTAPSAGPLEAIKLYDQILATYPHYPHADSVLYQKARALDELGRVDEAVTVMERLIDQYPDSSHIDEVQFRRGEYYFTRRKWLKAEGAYTAVKHIGAGTEYYPLALYKLGWTFYKQDLLDEALGEFIALLDWRSRAATTSTTRRTRTRSAGSRTHTASSASASRTSAVPRSCRSTSRSTARATTRTVSMPTWRSSISTSGATRTPRRPTTRSLRCTRCTALRRASACAWSRSTRRATSRSSCSSRRRLSRRPTACSPSTGATSM
jgi:tetratricopeptide (TPR) repeat protein